MIAGHYGAALAAKRVAPSVALWHLFVAVQLIDIAFSALVLLGVEKLRIVPGITRSNALDLYYMPYTHSLVGAIVWSVGAGLLYAAVRKSAAVSAAGVVGLAVFSHWLLDLPVHRPDLPLYDDVHKVGLGLWNVPVAAFLLEAGLVVGALLAYARGAPAEGRPSRRAVAIVGAILLALTVWSYVGPPASSVTFAVASGLVLYATVPIAAAWLERSAVKR